MQRRRLAEVVQSRMRKHHGAVDGDMRQQVSRPWPDGFGRPAAEGGGPLPVRQRD